ncbi:unnamed protein product [Staurois parvus]|uniref:Uncharacterized protein n=1 Tax=Staurois parvus TaxID=386267 RepID=A0ABN9FA79_9NEOB|nr:unnamed protein product [Staurois parvus]
MRLRTRKGSPRSSHGPAGRTARTKRKHSEEEEEEESSPLGDKLPKSDTGLLSTIKNFIKGSTTKEDRENPPKRSRVERDLDNNLITSTPRTVKKTKQAHCPRQTEKSSQWRSSKL